MHIDTTGEPRFSSFAVGSPLSETSRCVNLELIAELDLEIERHRLAQAAPRPALHASFPDVFFHFWSLYREPRAVHLRTWDDDKLRDVLNALSQTLTRKPCAWNPFDAARNEYMDWLSGEVMLEIARRV
jgi:hypothetical protein